MTGSGASSEATKIGGNQIKKGYKDVERIIKNSRLYSTGDGQA